MVSVLTVTGHFYTVTDATVTVTRVHFTHNWISYLHSNFEQVTVIMLPL